MSDLIDRQDAIDAMYKIVERNLDSSVFEDDLSENPHIDVIVDELENLPSAEPERKTGKWVNNINDMPICNQCGYMTPYDRAIDDYEYGNYCPNCGAKMEGESDE